MVTSSLAPLARLNIKVFADGANLDSIRRLAADPHIAGFTTNPTLMRKAGVTDYRAFAQEALAIVGNRPISFEVFADDEEGIIAQARAIASWGPNVYVKVPVTDTRGRSMGRAILALSSEGVYLNVTAVMTVEQVDWVHKALSPHVPAIISVFAGRVADTGVDPVHLYRNLATGKGKSSIQLLWASPRQLLDIILADRLGFDIITVTNDLLNKVPLLGKNLDEYSRETVEMFYTDAVTAGYTIPL